MKTKKLIVSFTICLAVILFYSSCTQKTNLEYNLEKDKKYYTELTGSINVDQTFQENQSKVNVDIYANYLTELESKTDNDLTINLNIDTMDMNMEMEINEEKKDFSDMPGGDALKNMESNMKGHFLTITMTKAGEPIEITGYEEWIQTLKDSLYNRYDSINKKMEKSLDNMYGKNMFENQMQKMFIIYPDKPIGIGDTWQDSTILKQFMPIKVVNNYKLTGINLNTAMIEGNSQVEMSTQDTLKSKIPMKYDISGSLNSDYKIDKNTGMIIEGEIDYSFGGEMIIMAIPGMTKEEKIPMNIKGTYKIKGWVE